MANVFHFNQFDVDQSRSAMKIGTDGVLLGAWTPVGDAATIWDVGCGTGLLSLMLAQRCDAKIFGIDIEAVAAEEARNNARNSLWRDRIEIRYGDINEINDSLPCPDLIVCNPPFFQNSLLNPDAARSAARHEQSLSARTIISLAAESLSPTGRLCLIAPTEKSEEIIWQSTLSRLYISRRTDIRMTPSKNPTRTLWELTKTVCVCTTSEETLRDENSDYSLWYRTLTADYYTHLKN